VKEFCDHANQVHNATTLYSKKLVLVIHNLHIPSRNRQQQLTTNSQFSLTTQQFPRNTHQLTTHKDKKYLHLI